MTTLIALLEGWGLYIGWWFRALLSWRDPRAPLGVKRIAVLLLGMPLFMLVQAVHAFCLLLDELLFPRYRKVVIDQALCITGIPRSGTTFLHRTIAVDDERYTTLTTWEALLAPSITQRRLIGLVSWCDRKLGGYGARAIAAITHRLTGGLASIHEVGLQAAEEDYLALLPAGGCFIMLLAFPGARGLQALGCLDERASVGRRRRLIRFYHRCLQRHLYADGGRRILLSKNAAFGGWVRELRDELPGIRFIICVREPTLALSSQISSVSSARALFGVDVDHQAFQGIFLDIYAEVLEHLALTLASWPQNQVAIVDMDDLRISPDEVITEALTRLELTPGPILAEHLRQLPRGGRSSHRHAAEALAFSEDNMASRLDPAYHRLLELPHRIRIDR